MNAPIRVRARRAWNDTGIDVQAGVSYAFEAAGEWFDLRTACGPDGYPSKNVLLRSTERWRRAPDRPWFELIGAIGRSGEELFPIGRSTRYQAQRSGRLFCFANDVRAMYWNNRGAVTLTVSSIERNG